RVVPIDQAVVVSDPSHLVNFNGVVFSAELVGGRTGEKLSVFNRPSRDASSIRLIEHDGKRKVVYQRSLAAIPVEIAETISDPNQPHLIAFRLNEQANTTSVEALLRSLAYEANGQSEGGDASIPIREVSRQRSPSVESDSVSRKLKVTLEGLRYDQSLRTTGLDQESLPKRLESTIVIELEDSSEVETSDDVATSADFQS
ncbi:MAG: hypothetical protein AAGJ83_03720, partial [Planctomycetota bacterium]